MLGTLRVIARPMCRASLPGCTPALQGPRANRRNYTSTGSAFAGLDE